MSDFYQTGVVATLHRLVPNGLDRWDCELTGFSSIRPIALLLPALYREFEGPAMPKIIEEPRNVPYLRQIVVALGGATLEKYNRARHMMAGLHPEVRFIWINGERIQNLYKELCDNNLPLTVDGKGRSCWMAYGYLLASQQSEVVALHDCDILTYNREMLARLCYPIANPNINFEFCKGYYARITDRMHCRVTRLLVTPLVRALTRILGAHPLLAFMDPLWTVFDTRSLASLPCGLTWPA